MVHTTFLDHLGVMGTLHLPIMTMAALPPPAEKPPRVPLFQYPIPKPILQGWKAKVMVKSHAATSLAKAIGHSLLASLGHGSKSIPTSDATDPCCIASSIVDLANDIQAILMDSVATGTDMFPHKPPAKPGRGTIPRHLWPKSAKHDVFTIRRRAKAIRRLINKEKKAQRDNSSSELPSDPYPSLWSSVTEPLSLRTILNLPPKDI
jgi:hypothetical protein